MSYLRHFINSFIVFCTAFHIVNLRIVFEEYKKVSCIYETFLYLQGSFIYKINTDEI